MSYSQTQRIFSVRRNPTRIIKSNLYVNWTTCKGIETTPWCYILFWPAEPISGWIDWNHRKSMAFCSLASAECRLGELNTTCMDMEMSMDWGKGCMQDILNWSGIISILEHLYGLLRASFLLPTVHPDAGTASVFFRVQGNTRVKRRYFWISNKERNISPWLDVQITQHHISSCTNLRNMNCLRKCRSPCPFSVTCQNLEKKQQRTRPQHSFQVQSAASWTM